MPALLKYGLEPSRSNGHRISIDVPLQTWERLQSKSIYAKGIESLSRKRNSALLVESGTDELRLLVNDKSITNSGIRTKLLRNLVQLVQGLESHTPVNNQDRDFRVQMTDLRNNTTSTRKTDMQLSWPNLAGDKLQDFVTETMVATAVKLKYHAKSILPSLVYANIDRETGVTLETDPVKESNVVTDIWSYDKNQQLLNLKSQNLHNNTQQIILLAGGIALARADTLVIP